MTSPENSSHQNRHSYNGDYKYAWIGVPTSTCPCYVQSNSPNGNFGIDAAISVIAHELVETATNPQLSSGWFSTQYGVENADQVKFTLKSCIYCFTLIFTKTNNDSLQNLL